MLMLTMLCALSITQLKFLHSFSQLLQQASSTTSSFNTIIDYNFDVVKECDIGMLNNWNFNIMCIDYHRGQRHTKMCNNTWTTKSHNAKTPKQHRVQRHKRTHKNTLITTTLCTKT